MKCEMTWKSGFEFVSSIRNHELILDANTAAGGHDRGATPKELVLAAICGCTGMDVIGLIKKSRTPLRSLKISAEAETTKDHPRVFTKVSLIYEAEGDLAQSEALVDAVKKSQNLYCGVSAMIAQACPIHYRVSLNGSQILEGKADFKPITLT